MEVTVTPRKLVVVLLACVVLLTAANLAVIVAQYGFGHWRLLGFARAFDVNGEANLPAYFSALQLLLAALLFGAIACARRRAGDRFTGHWFGLAALFAFLSVDEAALLHEMLGPPMMEHVPLPAGSTGWYIPYLMLLGAFAAPYLSFLRSLPPAVRYRLLACAALYVGGAVGMELVTEYLTTLQHLSQRARELRQALSVSLEELLEMLAVTALVHTLLGYAADHVGSARLTFSRDPVRRASALGAASGSETSPAPAPSSPLRRAD